MSPWPRAFFAQFDVPLLEVRRHDLIWLDRRDPRPVRVLHYPDVDPTVVLEAERLGLIQSLGALPLPRLPDAPLPQALESLPRAHLRRVK